MAVQMTTHDGSGNSTERICLNEGLRLVRNRLKTKGNENLDNLVIDAELERLLKKKM
jgi:hypothetical protein